MSINNHSTTTNLTGSDSDSDPDQYRIDEIIDFSQNESENAIREPERSTSDGSSGFGLLPDNIENVDKVNHTKTQRSYEMETPMKDNMFINTSNMHNMGHAGLPASPIAATRFIQQAMVDLQNDIIKRKAELEAIQQSHSKRNGSNMNVMKYLHERKSLFNDDSLGKNSDQISPTNLNTLGQKRSSSASRIPKRAMKRNPTPTSSHGVNVAELSMNAGSTDKLEGLDRPPHDNDSHLQTHSKLDESFEDDEDKIKIRHIQSRYKVYYRGLKLSPEEADNTHRQGFTPATTGYGHSTSTDNNNNSNNNNNNSNNSSSSRLHDSTNTSEHVKNVVFDDIVDQAVSVADHQIMNRLRSEQTRVAFLERRIEELEEENRFLMTKLSSTTHSQQWAEDAKLAVLEQRIAELEKECIEQAHKVKTSSLERSKLESRALQLEEDLAVARDELLLIRNQLQIKAMKLSTLENDVILYQRRTTQLEDDLNDAKRMVEEYESAGHTVSENLFHDDNDSVKSNVVDIDNGNSAVVNENYEEYKEKLAVLAKELEDVTRNRDEYILKYAHCEELLRQALAEKEQYLTELYLIRQQQQSQMDVTSAEKASLDAQAEIEIQYLKEQLKRSERTLLIYKHFYKLRDVMFESKVVELQALAELYELETKKSNHTKPKEIVKEVIKEIIVPSKSSSRSRVGNLILFAFLQMTIWVLILLSAYLYLSDLHTAHHRLPRYRLTH